MERKNLIDRTPIKSLKLNATLLHSVISVNRVGESQSYPYTPTLFRLRLKNGIKER